MTYYALFVLDLGSRRVQMVGSTPNPDAAFMIQAARRLTDAVDGFLTGHLELGMHGAVVLGHDVPAWLRPPGGAFNLLVEQVCGRRGVGRPDDLLLRLGQVAREARDAFREHPDPPVADVDVGEDVGDGE